MKNSAPASEASWRISSEVSEVTNPKGTCTPFARNVRSTSTPVISGMFQSDSTRSGFSATTASNACLPSAASTRSCPPYPA